MYVCVVLNNCYYFYSYYNNHFEGEFVMYKHKTLPYAVSKHHHHQISFSRRFPLSFICITILYVY